MRLTVKRIISAIVAVTVMMTLLSGCGNKNTKNDNNNEVKDNLICSINVPYNPTGEYSMEFSIEDGRDDEFASIDKADFELFELIRDEEKPIEDFKLEKIDDKTLSLAFKTDGEFKRLSQFVLATDKVATKNKCSLAAFIFVEVDTPDIDLKYNTVVDETTTISGKITINDGYTFVPQVTNDMIEVTSDINCNLELTRVSDSEVDFTITDMPEYYAGEIILLTIKKSIFGAEYLDDMEVCIEYSSAPVEYDASSLENDPLLEFNSEASEDIDEGDKIEGTTIVSSLATAAAKTAGGDIAGASTEIILSIIFEQMGLEPENNDVEDIKQSISGLSTELSAIRSILENTATMIESETNKILLDKYQDLGIDLSTKAKSIMRSDEVIKYVNKLKNSIDQSTGELKDKSIAKDKAFIKCVEKYMDKNYISNVLTYGSKIISGGMNTVPGIVDLYYNTLDNTYNYESQTYAAKEAFINQVTSVYILNAAIAIQYCTAIGDPNAEEIKTQMENVCTKLAEYHNTVQAMKDRANKGNDKILVSNQIISKTMQPIKVSDYKWDCGNGESILATHELQNKWINNIQALSVDTYTKMALRAKARGLSIAEELTKSGFTNVTTGNDNKYYYITCYNYRYEFAGIKFIDGFKSFFGTTKSDFAYAYADLILQDGRNDLVTKNKTEFARVISKGNIYKSFKERLDIYLENMIGFGKAN